MACNSVKPNFGCKRHDVIKVVRSEPQACGTSCTCGVNKSAEIYFCYIYNTLYNISHNLIILVNKHENMTSLIANS